MLVLAQVPGWLTAILSAVFLFFCILLILVVLIQRPAGGGLSGAFGSGAGSGQTAFGAKTGDALTIATITIFLIYLLLAVGLNFASRPPTAGPAVVQAGGAAPATQTPAPAGSTPPVVPATPAEAPPAGTFTPPEPAPVPSPAPEEAPAPAGDTPSPQPAGPG